MYNFANSIIQSLSSVRAPSIMPTMLLGSAPRGLESQIRLVFAQTKFRSKNTEPRSPHIVTNMDRAVAATLERFDASRSLQVFLAPKGTGKTTRFKRMMDLRQQSRFTGSIYLSAAWCTDYNELDAFFIFGETGVRPGVGDGKELWQYLPYPTEPDAGPLLLVIDHLDRPPTLRESAAFQKFFRELATYAHSNRTLACVVVTSDPKVAESIMTSSLAGRVEMAVKDMCRAEYGVTEGHVRSAMEHARVVMDNPTKKEFVRELVRAGTIGFMLEVVRLLKKEDEASRQDVMNRVQREAAWKEAEWIACAGRTVL